ncbi:BMP family ABC transporter substrate-binding protein [Sphaerisporangium sp. NBC_01403]|uniref:BMP family lipoprotein n=1 Tax=Sphaerisporangium sp. NBC_01403 TaxID=2903599 RepID=UPI003254FA74
MNHHVRSGIALTLVVTVGLCGSTAAATADAGSIKDKTAEASSVTARKVRIGVAYDIGGRGDQALNDSVAAGIDRAVAKLGLGPVEEVETGAGDTDEKREKLLSRLASEGHNPVIAVGLTYALPLAQIAVKYPRTKFAIVDDATFKGPNISNLLFAENEAGFLAGAAAALKSRAHHVGFVGGVKDPYNQKYQAGFQAGARAVRPRVKLDTSFITVSPDFGGFTDPQRGKAKARALYKKGADVVFHAAGASGSGVFAAAKAAGGLAIGSDVDEALSADATVRDAILTSVLKRADAAVYDFIKRFTTKKTKPGIKIYGMKSGGIDYATTGGKVHDIRIKLDAYKRKIATGAIKVPTRLSRPRGPLSHSSAQSAADAAEPVAPSVSMPAVGACSRR